MTDMIRSIRRPRTAIAICLLAAFGAAHAQGSEAETSVSVGVGVASGDKADRSWFGQYNGMRVDDVYGLLGIDYDRRNAATGTSVLFHGSNLGLDTREMIFQWKKQGDWRVSASYDELVRYDPYTFNTGLAGAGSAAPQVVRLGSAGSGYDYELKTKRKEFGVGLAKWFNPVLELDVNLKSEKKDGARQFGIGAICPPVVTPTPTCGATTATTSGWAALMLPEPIDATHHQVDARLSYAGERLRLSAGYYGSFYRNGNGSLNPVIPAVLNNPLGTPLPLYGDLRSLLALPVALAPDNEAHQFDLTGSFTFTPSTRATFKVAYTKATQDRGFADAGLTGAPAGSASLGGEVETVLAQVGITARPISKLTLSAEAKYEDKDDKTPLVRYFNDGVTQSTNRNYDYTKTRGKLQAAYHFTNDLLGSVGADYEKIDRGAYTASAKYAGLSALRQDTEETGVRLEVRHRMIYSFSGAISLQSSDRKGSDWLKPNPATGVSPVDPAVAFDGTSIFMPTLADRRRDKGRLFVTWQPLESLALQFNAEAGKDKFSAPSDQGLRSTKMELFSLDVNYAFSDEWNLTGYASQGKQKLHQAKPAGYILSFDNTSTTFGLGVTGKPSEKLSLGGELSYINDKNAYSQALDTLAHPGSVVLLGTTGGLPDILFRRTEFKLFGRYALTERSALRLDAVYQQAKYDDWAYGYAGVPYAFSDGTTAKLKQSQDAGFLGISYIYSWR